MSTLGNILWVIFGGLIIFVLYLIGSIMLMITMIGIPFGIQTLKIAGFAIWPFGREVRAGPKADNALYIIMNVIWRVSGAMLLGMALYKWGVLAARRSRAFYARWLVAGLAVGWPLILLGVHLHERAGWSMRYSMVLGWQINSWASLPVALAYASAVMLFCGRGLLPGPTARLAAVGRMAFTNYIVQTLICTTLFYGHGLGLYARLPFAQLFWLVLAIWVLQLAYSPWWLARFRFGPLEWLWRSLTYRTRQPFRRVPPQAAATPSLDSS